MNLVRGKKIYTYNNMVQEKLQSNVPQGADDHAATAQTPLEAVTAEGICYPSHGYAIYKKIV